MILLNNSIAAFPNQIPIEDCEYFKEKFDQLKMPRKPSRWSLESTAGINYREGVSKKLEDYEDKKRFNLIIKQPLIEYLKEFNIKTNVTDCGYDMNKYSVGQKCNHHYDGVTTGRSIRIATVIAFLTSCIGGNLVFPRQNAEIPIEQGTMVIFPPYYTHPHYAEPVTSGEKYIIVTWIEEL